MVMGDKIFNINDTLLANGGNIIKHLKNSNKKIDNLYQKIKDEKNISFKKFILTLDFLFIIDKIEIKEKDIIGLKK
jgi:NAD-dependent DNA ligase